MSSECKPKSQWALRTVKSVNSILFYFVQHPACRRQRSTTMPNCMHGPNAIFIIQGDYHDRGNQYNIHGASPGNYSLFTADSESNLIYYLRMVVISQIKYVYVPPHPVSPRFTGQETYLAKLREYFELPTDNMSGRRCFLLYGMGGVGKTQIALKFAEENSDR